MYDIIILGGGPAGLNAALYAARSNLKVLIISRIVGGAIAEAHKVENWLGTKSISGMELVNNFIEHVKSYGVEIKEEEVKGIRKKDDFFEVNGKYQARKIIISLGTERRKLNAEGEDKFLGKGVSYCATCDGAFFKNKVVGVVGGANSAADAALSLADIAKKVYVIYRGESLRAEPKRVEMINNNGKIEVIFSANVREIKGGSMMNAVMLDNGKEIAMDGLFIEIGSVPATTMAKEIGVELCDDGCIKVDERQSANIKGIFAAGDITNNSNGFRQVITAAAEGAVAARSAYGEIKEERGS
jgi:thioredoxin reductase (NADPH)